MNPNVEDTRYNPDQTLCPVPTKPDMLHALEPEKTGQFAAVSAFPSSYRLQNKNLSETV